MLPPLFHFQEINNRLHLEAVSVLFPGPVTHDRVSKKTVPVKIMTTQKHVVYDIHMGKQFHILECPGNTESGNLVRTLPCKFPPLKKDRSSLRPVKAANAVQKGGLPGPVRTDHRIEFARFHRKRYPVQGLYPPEGEGYILDI